MLYASVGETYLAKEIAQDRGSLGGKILRLTPEGRPAPGNPVPDSPVWSYGHRNVQGLAWDPGGRMYASEFGAKDFDELNIIEPGRNYGWPRAEGPSTDPELTNPIASWTPTRIASPSGIAIAGDHVYLACLAGQTLYRVGLDGRNPHKRCEWTAVKCKKTLTIYVGLTCALCGHVRGSYSSAARNSRKHAYQIGNAAGRNACRGLNSAIGTNFANSAAIAAHCKFTHGTAPFGGPNARWRSVNIEWPNACDRPNGPRCDVAGGGHHDGKRAHKVRNRALHELTGARGCARPGAGRVKIKCDEGRRGLRVRPSSGAVPRAEGGVVFSQPEDDPGYLSEVLGALARKHQVPGAQAAIHRAGHTVAVAVGETRHGSGDPVGRDTAFPIGSITKAFTATVAMVLVADADLCLDAPVRDYLPEFGAERDDRRAGITVRQLLSHTSGLAAGPDSVTSASMRRYVLDHCRPQHLVLPPGTAFSYSNVGYVLVGHLIEVVTGMSWWEAVELILLKPLGILPTFVTAPPPYAAQRPIASGHSVHPISGRTVSVKQNEPLVEAPAGSLAVSAADLVSFGRLHIGPGLPEVLPAGYAEQMRRAVPSADPFGLADGWGLGLAVFRDGTTDWVGHDGNADGTACYLRIDPANGRVVALTSNANTGAALWRDLLAELSGSSVLTGRHDLDPVPGRTIVSAADCVGTYANGDDEYQVLDRAGQLCLALDGEVIARLALVDELTFSLHEPASDLRLNLGRFHRDPVTGRIDGIHTMGRFARRRGQRIPRARDRAMSNI